VVKDAVTTAIQAVAGGTLVVAFALLGEVVRPKRLAGLFSAAPSIAIAGLIVTVVASGDVPASRAAFTMMLGAAGFVGFAATVRLLLRRTRALQASAAGCVVWIAIAVGGYLLAFG
jgi:uncharacterized membrane protein (GlpM family)